MGFCFSSRNSKIQPTKETNLSTSPNDESLITYNQYDLKNEEIVPKKVTKSKINLNDFKKLRLIGIGSYGRVYLTSAKNNSDKLYAVKVLNKKDIEKENLLKNIQTEKKIMEQINYPFIMKLDYAFQTQKRLFLFTQFMSGGDISYHIYKENLFSEEKTIFYSSEIILALEHLHLNNYIYRDLKPENVAIDNDGHIKLIDFGLCKLLNNKNNNFSVCGSPDYVAPEVLFNNKYDNKVDIWSLGVMIYEMLSGYLPFKIKSNKISMDLYNQKVQMFKYFSKDAKCLIKNLLVIDPQKRYNITQIKKHKFFKNINWDLVEQKKYTPPFIPDVNNNNLCEYFKDEKELKSEWTKQEITKNPKSFVCSNSINEKEIGNEEIFENQDSKIIEDDVNFPKFFYSAEDERVLFY